MKRPFFVIACAFLLGILWESKGPGWLVPVLLFTCGAAAIQRRAKCGQILLISLLICLAFSSGFLRARTADKQREQYTASLVEGENICVGGRLDRKENRYGSWRYYLTQTVVEREGRKIPCNSCILYVTEDSHHIGDILYCKGKLILFETASNEGMFDQRSFYAAQKIDFAVRVKECVCIRESRLPLREWIFRLKNKALKLLQQAVGPWEIVPAMSGNSGILASMLLGDKTSMEEELKNLYQSAGISHILAISGLHVSMVGMSFYQLLRKSRLSFAGSAFAAAIFLLAYVEMTGASVSSRRAAVMLCLNLIANIFGRSGDLANSLGIACLLLLWENPFLIGYSGFWFSAASVAAIFLVTEILPTPNPGKKHKNLREIGEGILANMAQSCFLSLLLLPVMAYFYGEVPLYAGLLNVLVLPTMSIVFVSAAVAVIPGCFIKLPLKLSSYLLFPGEVLLTFYTKACRSILAVPGSVLVTGHPGLCRMLLYYLLIASGIIAGKKLVEQYKEETKKRGRIRWGGQCILWGMVLLLIVPLPIGILRYPHMRRQEITFLDLGQGEGIFLHTEDGLNCFIDGGSSDVKQVGSRRILPFLKYRGVDCIDYWFVSHVDTDHISGLLEVLQEDYPVKNLILAADEVEDEKRDMLISLAKKAGSSILFMGQGDLLRSGSTEFVCLKPDAGSEGEAKNDRSLVLLYRSSDFSAFFGGDISEEIENVLLKEAAGREELQAMLRELTLYKVSHHGSRYSSGEAFLDLLSPQISVISCGEGNSYGHPHEETLERIKKAGSEVYRTDLCGEICIRKDQVYTPFAGE